MRTTAAITVMTLCTGFAAFAEAPSRPTFTKDVAPILHNNCVNCHRAGQSAPMSLITYDEARPWAKAIGKNVAEGTMPPWHADKGIGHFSNDRSLTEDEIRTIVRWVEQGAKRGAPADMPPIPQFDDTEWALGEPDYIATFNPVTVPGGGPDRFHDLAVRTDLPEDKWISAVEVRPSNTKVAHHVIVYQLAPGQQGPEGWLGAWAAGMQPMVFGEGHGRMLKKGATLVGDMHYHPAEDEQTDQTSLGLYFADEDEIEKEVINLWIQNGNFRIPAGDPSYKARASYTFPQDAYITSLLPHMHYRGKSFSYTAKYPDGRKEKLLSVSNYDFAWQTQYYLEEPLFMPKGTRIDCIAEWDNSANNPNNPDPTRDVTFGDESFDEMMIGFVDYVVADGLRPKSPDEALKEIASDWQSEGKTGIYRLDAVDPDDGDSYPGVIHLPKSGNGEWRLSLMGAVQIANVTGIQWEGNHFKATVAIPALGTFDFDGTVDTTGDVAGKLVVPDTFTLKLEGKQLN